MGEEAVLDKPRFRCGPKTGVPANYKVSPVSHPGPERAPLPHSFVAVACWAVNGHYYLDAAKALDFVRSLTPVEAKAFPVTLHRGDDGEFYQMTVSRVRVFDAAPLPVSGKAGDVVEIVFPVPPGVTVTVVDHLGEDA